jgi:23S rRNA pseudouridine2605 synthase
MEERLQKILASAGIGSRRTCEDLIKAGRVTVNRAVAEIGQKADAVKDKIAVDGRLIKPPEQKIYIALNKPKYYLSTVEAEPGDTRPTVRDLVPVPERLYPVGRLDFESEGLILLTNDGDLAQRLQHPRYEHEKEYRVLVAKHPDQDQLSAWRHGVVLEDGFRTHPADVRVEKEAGKGMWLRVILKEGHKRQIREMGSKTGLPVVRIIRIRMGTLYLGNLKPKEWRPLTAQEVPALKSGFSTKPQRNLGEKSKSKAMRRKKR